MRGSDHSKDIREYVITDKGVVVIRPRSADYDRLTTGIPTRTDLRPAYKEEAAPEPKTKK
jgi:circadian clock protein KaiC